MIHGKLGRVDGIALKELSANESIGYRIEKKGISWFNEKCKTAIDDRDTVKMEKIEDDSNEKKNPLAQKRRYKTSNGRMNTKCNRI